MNPDTTTAVAAPTDVRAPAPEGTPAGAWPVWQRFLFAYVACHWLLYAFPRPFSSVLGILVRGARWVDKKLEWGIDWSSWPWRWPGKWLQELGEINGGWKALTSWLADRHLTPYEVIHQRTGSGDTGHDWAKVLVIVAVSFVVAAVAAVVWRSAVRPVVWRTLHLLVRWDLAFTLLGYGASKLYGSQFGELGPTRLTTEIGDVAPMTMVGTFMQANPAYEAFGGLCEVIGGLLLFHPRTALFGAAVSFATMANVCALNWLCGVPVKLFSAHLMLFALFLMAPWRSRLWALFVSNQPSSPATVTITAVPRARRIMMAAGLFIVGTHLFLTHVERVAPKAWLAGLEKSEWYGVWQVETMRLDGREVPATDAARWRYFAVERGKRAWVRTATGETQALAMTLGGDGVTATVRSLTGSFSNEGWSLARGRKTVPAWNPVPLRIEERGKPVDVDVRTLKVSGTWQGQPLEFEAFEKPWKLQTGFRLRQELPDFW